MGTHFYGSPALATMNERLGESVALPVGKAFGRADGGSTAWRWSRDETWHGGVELAAWRDNVAAAGNDPSPARVRASTMFQTLSFSGAFRFLPLPRFKSSGIDPYLGLLGYRAFARGTNTIKGFHALLLTQVGVTRFAHAFELDVPRADTRVSYEGWSLGAHYGGGLRLAWRLGQWIDLEIDGCYLQTLPLLARSSVGTFEVRGQDLRARSSELGVEGIARSRWQIVTAKAGASIFF